MPRGTTTVVTDPHEIANVLGLEGIRFMFESAKYGPLSMYVMASSCVPATDMATNGAVLHGYDLFPLKSDPWVLGLAEVMNFPGVVARRRRGAREDRRLPGPGDRRSCAAPDGAPPAGVRGGGHRRRTTSRRRAEEALEKLRLGMMVFIREGTVARDLDALLPLVNAGTQHRFCFCTDDCQPADLVERGGIDHMVRRSIAAGLDPIQAIRLATWNAAQHFRLHNRGAITPGRRADLVVFDDLQAPVARLVFRNGQLVAQDGRMVVEPRPQSRMLRGTMNVAWDSVDFRIPAEGRRARVIGATDTARDAGTRRRRRRSPTATPWPTRRAICSRWPSSSGTWHPAPWGGVSSQGIGLQRGALASSVAHDHHNLVVIGADDASMMTAARRVAALHGGMVVAVGDRVLAEVPLPLGGLMSQEPVETVHRQVTAAVAAARSPGLAAARPVHDDGIPGAGGDPGAEADGPGAGGRREVRTRAPVGGLGQMQKGPGPLLGRGGRMSDEQGRSGLTAAERHALEERAAWSAVSAAFGSLGRAFVCVDGDFRIIHGSYVLERGVRPRGVGARGGPDARGRVRTASSSGRPARCARRCWPASGARAGARACASATAKRG